MTEQEFLEGFAEAIGSDGGSLLPDTDLTSLENWDSVAYLAVMTMVDERTGIALNPEQLTASKTPREIYMLASGPGA